MASDQRQSDHAGKDAVPRDQQCRLRLPEPTKPNSRLGSAEASQIRALLPSECAGERDDDGFQVISQCKQGDISGCAASTPRRAESRRKENSRHGCERTVRHPSSSAGREIRQHTHATKAPKAFDRCSHASGAAGDKTRRGRHTNNSARQAGRQDGKKVEEERPEEQRRSRPQLRPSSHRRGVRSEAPRDSPRQSGSRDDRQIWNAGSKSSFACGASAVRTTQHRQHLCGRGQAKRRTIASAHRGEAERVVRQGAKREPRPSSTGARPSRRCLSSARGGVDGDPAARNSRKRAIS